MCVNVKVRPDSLLTVFSVAGTLTMFGAELVRVTTAPSYGVGPLKYNEPPAVISQPPTMVLGEIDK